ncbi:MAG: hypothetical protein WBX81_09170, partial [Nitrososphaeraceae archaeon]
IPTARRTITRFRKYTRTTRGSTDRYKNRYPEKVLWSYFSDLDRVSDGNNPFTYQDQLIV